MTPLPADHLQALQHALPADAEGCRSQSIATASLNLPKVPKEFPFSLQNILSSGIGATDRDDKGSAGVLQISCQLAVVLSVSCSPQWRQSKQWSSRCGKSHSSQLIRLMMSALVHTLTPALMHSGPRRHH